MRDLLLGPDGDLVVDEGLEIAERTDAVKQLIATRLRFNQGEWYLDLRVGAPLFRILGAKGISIELIQSTFRDIIGGTPGVATVDQLTVDIDADRNLLVKFRVSIDNGVVIAGNETLIFGAPDAATPTTDGVVQ